MELQTRMPLVKQSKNLIDYNSNILLFGSCFSENIGDKLSYFKFQTVQNPFGILFQPKAIETLISNAVSKQYYSENDVFFHNEQWHCFDAHSRLSSISKEILLKELNNQLELTHQQINASTHIIITLGTAWVYRFLESGKRVANCHKVPQKEFSKELLSIEQIKESLQNIIDSIRSVNKDAVIIFTVSPVRHLKDGFVENMQSKSHLISAIHSINQKLATNSQQQITNNYFPSYEIMMDELRDYRFYADDMIHPNQLAINYIWESFIRVWISDDAIKTMDEVDSIQKGMQHKPFNPSSQAHQVFLQTLELKKADLKKQFPHVEF